MKFQVGCFDLFRLFSVIDSIRWSWMISLRKSIQLHVFFYISNRVAKGLMLKMV